MKPRYCKICGLRLAELNPGRECFYHPPELPNYRDGSRRHDSRKYTERKIRRATNLKQRRVSV